MWPLVFALFAMTSPEGKHERVDPRAIPKPCHARFERARAELIARGFAPTFDKDTRRWLQVAAYHGTLQLKLEMRSSADGPATFYSLDVYHPRNVQPMRWRTRRGKYCCDEHAAAEDRLFEHRWMRSNARFIATISVVEFENDLKDPASKQQRDLFVEAARRAADDCLAL
jgi:hypothetical protein